MIQRALGSLFLLTGLALFACVARALWLQPGDLLGHLVRSLPMALVAGLDLELARRLLSKAPRERRCRLFALVAAIASATMLGYVVVVLYVDAGLAGRSYAGVYDDCYKVWGARGLVPEHRAILRDGKQNSIESIQLAFDTGAKGTEVDVYFDPETQRFVVSHDRNPYNLKNGELLTLEALFEATGERGYYWLDFKKLRLLDERSLRASIAELEALAAKHDLGSRLYVEGEDPLHLSVYRDAGFATILDSHPLTDDNPLTPIVVNFYKAIFYFGDFTVFSLNYGSPADPIYGPRTRALLGDIPVFVYHVEDDAEVLNALAAMDAVRVILVVDQSVARYDVSGCP